MPSKACSAEELPLIPNPGLLCSRYKLILLTPLLTACCDALLPLQNTRAPRGPRLCFLFIFQYFKCPAQGLGCGRYSEKPLFAGTSWGEVGPSRKDMTQPGELLAQKPQGSNIPGHDGPRKSRTSASEKGPSLRWETGRTAP